MLIPIMVKSGVKMGSEEGIEVIVKDTDQGLFKKKQILIFFPKVFISNLNDVWEVRNYAFTVPYGEERVYPAASDLAGHVLVEGKGNDGKTYWAIIHCEELFRRLQPEAEEKRRQLVRALFEREKQRIEDLEKAGRYEEAALEYERFQMFEKAGELRRKMREMTVVQVDLNNLIRQMGERGLTFTYNCSNCGAPLKIEAETKVDAVQFCSHCGSRIEAIDLARFIRSHLS